MVYPAIIFILTILFIMVDMMKRKKVLKEIKEDYSSIEKIEYLIDKWRDLLGIDPVYLIYLKIGITENQALSNSPAWVEGLDKDNMHPTVNLCINAKWLEENKYNGAAVEETIIHELLHIICFDAFMMANPEYRYAGMMARANEILTIKITNTIMKILK